MAQALSRDEFLAQMQSRIRGREHRTHPIVQAVEKGTATPEQIGYLAVLFFHFTKHTPQVISTIHSRCDDPAIRRKIMDTLIDEDTELRCGSASHHQLALDFATRFIGCTEQEVIDHPVPQLLLDMTAYRYKVAHEMPVPIALGNSGIAGESHFPDTVVMISEGLRNHYGVKDEDQESWIVHIDGDAEHGDTALKPVLATCTTGDLQEKMLWCIDNYLDHWARFWRESERGEKLKIPIRRRSAAAAE
ncbi:MAG TPA: iron-containing redox enzyme family protein [Alphaproteobacteria bacterium]